MFYTTVIFGQSSTGTNQLECFYDQRDNQAGDAFSPYCSLQQKISNQITSPEIWKFGMIQGALSPRLCCILIKATQIFNIGYFYNMKVFVEHREENIN